MKLIFETPSRNCQNRAHNGSEVRIVGVYRERTVRRIGRHVNTYLVERADLMEAPFEALPDELFLDPI